MFTIANRTMAQAEIIIPKQASAANEFAAHELAKYLEAICGAEFNIFRDDYAFSSSPDRYEICIGAVNRPETPSAEGLKNDGYILRTVGNRLFILGENDRGALYGVYGFLEDVLGCRFFAKGAEKIPNRAVLSFGDLDLTRVSPFEYRETMWYAVEPADIAYKRGLNGPRHGLDPVRGGGIAYDGFVHTFQNDYITVEEYFETHPEYFSMVDGKRVGGSHQTQLCLTNPDVLRIVIEKLRKKLVLFGAENIFHIPERLLQPLPMPGMRPGGRGGRQPRRYAAALCQRLR